MTGTHNEERADAHGKGVEVGDVPSPDGGPGPGAGVVVPVDQHAALVRIPWGWASAGETSATISKSGSPARDTRIQGLEEMQNKTKVPAGSAHLADVGRQVLVRSSQAHRTFESAFLGGSSSR